ncbi:low-affinity phosphate transporter [Ophidiomyces ophidiicola]|nr:low-affinity phosphate transporter [Ophidiomyces ophidiicola]
MVFKVGACLLFLATAIQARLPAVPLGEFGLQSELPSDVEKDDLSKLYPEHTISVPIDHFQKDKRYEPHSNDTFKLRYWFDASNYKDGGPVIVLHGGETDGKGRLPFLQKGMLAQLARATNGVGVVLEHRYYGTSIPTPDFSTKNLRFLSTEQAMADSAFFSKNVVFKGLEKKDLRAPKTPHILYGGSYAGAQVAFLRVEYPDVFWGAISSSGVPKAIYHYWEYYEATRKHAPQHCVKQTQIFVDLVDNIILRGKDPKMNDKVKEFFSLSDLAHMDDVVNVLANGISGWQGTNWDPAINRPGFSQYCDKITSDKLLYPVSDAQKELATTLIKAGKYGHEGRKLLNRFLNYAGWANATYVAPCLRRGSTLEKCYGTHDPAFYKQDDLEQDWRLWPYQFCTEWGFLQTGSGVPKHIQPLISRVIDLEYTSLICREAFGIHKEAETDRVNKWGGYDIEYLRLAFVDGEADPWVEASPHATAAKPRKHTLDKPFILIKDAVHHWDENGVFPNETTPTFPPPRIQKVQAQEIEFVKKWLKVSSWARLAQPNTQRDDASAAGGCTEKDREIHAAGGGGRAEHSLLPRLPRRCWPFLGRPSSSSSSSSPLLRLATEEETMKFSHSIQFNAVPEWSDNYIAYSNLKKLIYSLEKQINNPEAHDDEVEDAPLLDRVLDTDSIFVRMLDGELEKICSFYHAKEIDLYKEVDDVVNQAESYISESTGFNMDPLGDPMAKSRTLSFGNGVRRASSFGIGPSTGSRANTSPPADEDSNADADSDDDVDISELPTRDIRRRSMLLRDHEPLDGRAVSDMSDSRYFGMGSEHVCDGDPHLLALYNAGVSLKKHIIGVYVSLCGLKSFIQLNRTGFSKALKKYDKTLDRSLRRGYMNTTVSTAYPFTNPTISLLDEKIARIERLYADTVTKGDLPLSKRELRLHLREHVVWERNTVWREMIGIERKAQAANMGIRSTLLGGAQDAEAARRQGDEQESATKEIRTPVGRCPVPRWMLTSNFTTLILILVVFGAMLSVPIMKKPEQQNCLAMLVFVSLLWATEVIPLFVTSILVPFLVVVLRVLKSDDGELRLQAKDAATYVFASMWTSVIMLLLGGFTIAAALSKHDIARRMATFVLSKAGTKPRTVLVTNMFVSMVLSMWISNVAAPVLCFSIIQPMLRNLPPDSRFSKALVLGIALASNVGGAASPIASPQNIIALQNMSPPISWGTWFFIAIPVCVICIILIWILLVITFRPGRGTVIVPIRQVKDKFSGVQWFVTIVTLATIILWCFSHEMEGTFGDMGVIAIIPLVLFFGTGVLNKEDFNNFLWTIIILASGGLCLGKAVTSSGLLHTIARSITENVGSFSLYGVMFVFASLILVIATFISHTVAALIMLPLVREVGVAMDHPHPNLLVMGSALMCSVAMGLPTSGFPNMTAIMMEVPETGQRYLRVKHFISRGIPASLISFAVVVTVGYGLMIVAGL